MIFELYLSLLLSKLHRRKRFRLRRFILPSCNSGFHVSRR